MMNVIANIATHLRDTIGLDVHSVGNGILATAVQARMRHCRVKEHEQYFTRLIERESERQALIEEVVVAETWFFRDWKPFALLGQWAANTWLPAHSEGVLRVLSAPCSTGEEPFSIVMALLDAGLPPHRFSVEAVDISQRALAHARKGAYSQNSFRDTHQEFRQTYFEKAGTGWRLGQLVTGQVQFEHANLVDPCFRVGETGLDVIFCRNLLIYLAPEIQKALIGRLRAMLSPEGLLFVGHAEAFIASQCGFDPVQPMTFAFRKRPVEAKTSSGDSAARARLACRRRRPADADFSPTLGFPATMPLARAPKAAREGACPPRTVSDDVPSLPSAPTPAAAFREIQRLADRGNYDAAKEKGEDCLRVHGPSSHLLCLLGLIHEASGNGDCAREFYRKALYLEPGHLEALAHLALLERAAGNRAAASRLESRMRNAESTARNHSLSTS